MVEKKYTDEEMLLVDENIWGSTPEWVKKKAKENGYGEIGKIVWWQLSELLKNGEELAEEIGEKYDFSRSRVD